MSLSLREPQIATLGTLPVTASGVNDRARKAPANAVVSLKPLILLVDDDPTVLRLTEIMLVAAGYRVSMASDAQQALAIFRRYPTIDLLLTDIHMPPGINGLELAGIISLERPELPIVVVSGAVLTAEQERMIRDRSWAFVDKPLLVPRLLSVISMLLRRPPSRSSSTPFSFPKAV